MKAAVERIDLRKIVPSYAARRGRFDIIDVPPTRYVAADAEGTPEGESFAGALGALFPLAYGLKFASKKEQGRDYVVPPLEALWWADDPAAFTSGDKSAWRSTALMLLPEWITDVDVEAAREAVVAKVPAEDLARVRVEVLEEGRCAQTLHVGPFSEEGPVIEELHAVLEGAGLALAGKHHEIYLSDFRRTAPEKLRTILRQPGAVRN
ncbi:GyrI-like domain-containing protein [Demequina sp.]|uniref:GyrI-like domain-containing protein n=1 Tax=Demequina sp. TaxID=2050685 RepID=UPI0025C20945|nr:GyrI-like domain-containing protein [Demequina sp.]